MGDHPWQRIYICRDKWIYVGASADRTEILAEVVTGNPDAGEQALDAAFAGQDCAHWLSRLQAAGIACHQVMSGDDILDAANVRRVNNDEADETAENSIEFIRQENHPCGKPIVSQAPNWVRVGEQRSWKRLRVDPSIGEDTREILKGLGYQENDITELIRLNVAYEYLPALGAKTVYFFEQKEPGETA